MLAKDLYHELVKTALKNEGWMITHDPYHIDLGFVDFYSASRCSGGMGEWGSGGSEQQTQFSFGLFWLSLKTAIYVPHSRGNCYILI